MPDHSLTGHVVPSRVYILTFVALIVLTVLTTGVAYIDLGYFNTVVALVIAVSKATCVVLFFMGLKYHKGLTRIVIIAALLWLSFLIVLTLADMHSRDWAPLPQPWQKAALSEPHR